MSNNYIDELFDNLRRDPFNNNPTNDTSYELQKDFLSDPQGPEGWIADGVITDVELVDGSTLVGKVDALPTLPDADYPEGKVVYLTTNGKLYRNDSDVWTSAVPAVDLTGQITETQITDGSITTAKVAANAIVADKIASNAITTDKLNANAVTAAKIAAGTITATEIAAGTITAAKMVAGTITAASAIIADAAITNAKIADATIQSAKIVNLTAEKITGGYYGILIQANTTGVDSAFGGQDNALIFSGLTVGNLGITGVGDAAIYAPNRIYLDSEGTTYDPSLATSTANGVSIVGDDVALIVSPQVMIGNTGVLNSGDTIYISSAGVVVNGGLTSNSTLNAPSIVMPGSTSGTITINPTAVAGATVLTLPATTGTVALTSQIPSITGTTFDLTGDVTVTAAAFTVGGANTYSVSVDNDSHTHTSATLGTLALGTDTSGNYVAGVTSANSLITVSGSGAEGAAVVLTADTSPTFSGLITGSGGAEISGAIDLNSNISATSLSATSNITNSRDVRIFYGTGGGFAQWRVFQDSSSERYKTNIVYMDDSDEILDVRPVSYHDKTHYEEHDETSPRQYGFLAEEMAENFDGRDFTVFNEDGTPEAIQYSRLVVPLHSAMRKLRSRIDNLEERLAALEGDVA